MSSCLATPAHICIYLSTAYRWEQGDAVAVGEEVIKGGCCPTDKNEVDTLLRDASSTTIRSTVLPSSSFTRNGFPAFNPGQILSSDTCSLASTGVIGTIAFLLREVPLVEELHIVGKDSQAITWLHFSR